MPAGLNYQSSDSRGHEVRQSRRGTARWLLTAAGILITIVFGLAGVVLYLASQPTLNRVKLTITNATPGPLSDIGFSDFYNDRVVPMGPVAPGQTRVLTAKYNENDCPTGFSFDQSGQTWRVRLGGGLLDDDVAYTVTVTPGLLTTTCVPNGGPTTRYVQVPTTQPVVYLDQSGHPIPPSR